jgi:hypothetical protein
MLRSEEWLRRLSKATLAIRNKEGFKENPQRRKVLDSDAGQAWKLYAVSED